MLTSVYWKKGKPVATGLSRAEMMNALKDKDGLLWVDLEEPTEFESECLIEIFNFHDLAIEDCLSDQSNPKVDDYEEYLFLVMQAVATKHHEEKKTEELCTRELDIFFSENYLVTFHKVPVKTVTTVREQVLKHPERWMGQGADLLLHTVLDHLVDNYMPVLSRYDERIDKLEEEIFNNPPADYLATVMQVKQDVFHLRRIIAPQRDTINYLIRNAGGYIASQHLAYFRDINDHLVRVYGAAEAFHENLGSILHAYFSYSSHKLNEVVKHMTVLATLTMPLLIVASIYGMNFRHMPELDWKYGYPFSLGIGIFISVVILIWMKFKKWI